MTESSNPTENHWPNLAFSGSRLNYVAPYALARCAIFSTQIFRGQLTRPQFTEKTELASLGNMHVYQLSGEQLDQGDADVFYELMRRVVVSGASGVREARIQFNQLEFLSALGRKKGGKTLALLRESLCRLTDAAFFFQVPGVLTGRSRLILKMLTREDVDGLEHDYDVLLDLELANLFNREQWTFLNKKERTLLAGDPLAKGLHAYYSTHREPYPLLPGSLKTLMGRTFMQESKWRLALDTSLANLKNATQWHKCDLEMHGKYAGKVVVQKIAKPLKNSNKQVAAIPAGDPMQQDACGSIESFNDLQDWPLSKICALMNASTLEEWNEYLLGPGELPPESFQKQAALGILYSQWVNSKKKQDPSWFDDADI